MLASCFFSQSLFIHWLEASERKQTSSAEYLIDPCESGVPWLVIVTVQRGEIVPTSQRILGGQKPDPCCLLVSGVNGLATVGGTEVILARDVCSDKGEQRVKIICYQCLRSKV